VLSCAYEPKEGGCVDRSLYKGVWVYAEQRHGKIASVVYELLNEGKRLANKLETFLCVVLIGSNIRTKVQELIKRGADKVYVYDAHVFSEFQDGPYTYALAQLIKKEKPEVILIGDTEIGRSFASRVAANVCTGLTAHCTSFEIDYVTKNLQQISCSSFERNIVATILTPRHRPQMATVKPRVFMEAKIEEGRSGEVIECEMDEESNLFNRTKFLEFIKNKNATANLTDVDVIVSGGRGLGKSDGFKLIKELANLIGGAVGASKAVVDLNWVSYFHQIGQTGKTVNPKIYIACGISGQTQHTVGMNSSNIIVAINKDPSCPMMQLANYALEGDLHEIIPNIIKEIKMSRADR
jgi:electron transfer flavoprotein alpha subunit